MDGLISKDLPLPPICFDLCGQALEDWWWLDSERGQCGHWPGLNRSQ